MDVDTLCEQMKIYHENYEWIIRESERIVAQFNVLDKATVFHPRKYEMLTQKYMELIQRYTRDKQDYNKIMGVARTYFQDTHGVDIMGLLEGDAGEVK